MNKNLKIPTIFIGFILSILRFFLIFYREIMQKN